MFEEQKKGGREQILRSKGNMDCLVRESTDEITKIKLEMEKQEKERKLREEERRNKRLKEIQEESYECGRNMAAIEMKWSEMREIEECELLQKEINNQSDLFNIVREGKNNLIKKFQEELKKKEDEYSKMLKRQSKDISLTIEKMRKQFFNLRERYLYDLEAVQVEFIKEREDQIKQNEQQIQTLFEKHQSLESKFVQNRDQKELEYAQQIEILRIDGSKNYASFKISMETDIQNILKCYEDMKALFQLNTEKLDYNLKILKEKNEEGKKIEDEKIKKNRELNEQCRKLIKLYDKNDDQFKKENKILTSKYKQITQQFKELQKKVKHFKKADSDRYTEIQKMNEAEVQKLKDKILKCDITIHVQQLGMPWNNQQNEEEEGEEDKSIQQQQQQQQSQQQDIQFGSTIKQDQQILELEEEQLKNIINMIIEETDFLLDDKVRDIISKSSEEEAMLIKMEQIKKTLSIDSEDEINMLFQYLNEKIFEKQSYLKKLQQQRFTEKNEESQQEAEQEMIDEVVQEEEQIDLQDDYYDQIDIKNEMIQLLQDFIFNKDKRKKILEQMNKKKSVIQETERQKKERIAKIGKNYWTKLTQVLPEKTLNVWKTLDRSLSKYYELLLQRQKLIDQTGELHNQNEELKNLLNQYLQINHELIIPPTRLIKLENNQQSQQQQQKNNEYNSQINNQSV